MGFDGHAHCQANQLHTRGVSGCLHLAYLHKQVNTFTPPTHPTPLGEGTPQPKWAVPRQTAALPIHSSGGQLLCGISAYAFQGTNAHAIIQRPPEAARGNGGSTLPKTCKPMASLWQKEAHWVGSPVHALLHSGRAVAAGSRKAAVVMECHLSATPRLAFFWDHRVGGRVLFPGAGFFEVATAAAKAAVGKGGTAAVALLAATIPAPLQLPDQQQLQKAVPLLLRVSIRLTTGALAVSSSPAAFKQQHLSGTTAFIGAVDAPIADSTAAAAEPVSQRLAAMLSSGAASQASQPAAHASIDNSDCDGSSHFHPASLDSCLQLAAAATSTALKVPASLGCLHVPDRLTAPQLAAASRQQGGATASDMPSVVDYCLSEASGGLGLGVSSLELKPLGKLPTAALARATASATAPAAAASDLLYEVGWPAAEPATTASADAAATAATLQLLPSSGLTMAAGAIAALQEAQLETLGGAQFNTRGALLATQAPAGTSRSAAEGGMSGLMRTLALEYQAQRFGSVDADRQAAHSASSSAGAQLALLPPGTAPAADAYGAARRAGVQQRAALLPAKARSSTPAFHLMPLPRGALSSLTPQPVDSASVAPGQVLLAVKAVGVNFR